MCNKFPLNESHLNIQENGGHNYLRGFRIFSEKESMIDGQHGFYNNRYCLTNLLFFLMRYDMNDIQQ